jgi:hypothetical protein
MLAEPVCSRTPVSNVHVYTSTCIAHAGMLTELVSLSHQFSMEFWRQGRFPLPELPEGQTQYSDDESRAYDRKGWQALGVTEAHRASPRFARGRELLVYRDSDHLHRSPDGCARASIWRFQ